MLFRIYFSFAQSSSKFLRRRSIEELWSVLQWISWCRQHWSDRQTPLHGRQVTRVAFNTQQKVPYAFGDAALCSAVLGQSDTKTTASLVPWPVSGHQRLDTCRCPLGASQQGEKTEKKVHSFASASTILNPRVKCQ